MRYAWPDLRTAERRVKVKIFEKLLSALALLSHLSELLMKFVKIVVKGLESAMDAIKRSGLFSRKIK